MDPIFDVNPEADVCYCPICMRELKPKEAIDNYNFFISTKIDKANRLLFRDTRFLEAYESFGDVLRIDSTSHRARFGRILSLVYMSTLRHSNFPKADLLLKEEAEEYFRKLKDQYSYMKFLNRVDYALDEYFKRFYKKLVVKDRFYSLECAELYFIRVNEIITLKETIANELDKSYIKTSDERIKNLYNSVNKSIKEMYRCLERRALIVDGKRYKFEKVVKNNQVLFSQLDETVNPLTNYHHRKLEENEKKGKLIRDKVYPDNSHLTALAGGIFPVFIIFAAFAILSFVGTFVKQFEDQKFYLYIVSGICLLFAITALVFFIIWKTQLSRRHHLID